MIKHIRNLLLTLFIIGIFSFQNKEGFLPTKLKISVIDNLGNFVEGASVSIYTSEEDYRASENAIARVSSNEKGQALFKGLEPISYYIDAQKGDLNNNAAGVKTAALKEGRVNKVNTIIE
ncbi:MAG: carboxypeptidase regulatory-like domain-containing protein [Cyclobacteriaceae bacterium]